jgi:hypothetical protein
MAAPPPVYLHIGAMKTGTTYLQTLMSANREHLAADGFMVTGPKSARAVQDVLRLTRRDPRIKAESAGAWQRTVDQLHAHTGTAAVFSMEYLSFATRTGARRVLRSLEPAEVHVVLTVRDALATIPAHWQTSVRNGGRVSWPDFMRDVRKTTTLQGRLGRFSPHLPVRAFSIAHGIPRILRAWGEHLPAGRLHVVTVPRPGADRRLLWERFAAATGMDPHGCPEPPARSNESLGYGSTEFLRRVNVELGRMRPTDYNPTLSVHLGPRVLSGRDESRAQTDLATRRFAVDWNARVRDAIRSSGAHVIGDLDDLPTELSASESVGDVGGVPEPDQREMLSAAAAALDGMQELVDRRARRLRKAGLEAPVAARVGPRSPGRWADARDPVATAAAEVAEVARVAIGLHSRLRQLPNGG